MKYPELAIKYPQGVQIAPEGFPDFSPYARETVQFPNIGPSRDADFAKANEAVGLADTPVGWVWHHVEDAQTLQLIPKDLHEAIRHWGGSARYIGVLGEGE